MTDLDGCVVLLTGADCGDGARIIRTLVSRGARVCASGRDERGLRDAVDGAGPDAVIAAPGRALDLRHRRGTLERTLEEFGGLDLLVNCPGMVTGSGPIFDFDDQLAANLYSANVLAPLAWVRTVHQGWMKRHGGTVLNLTSAYREGSHGWAAAATAALRRITADLASELEPRVHVRSLGSAEELDSALIVGIGARRATRLVLK